MNREKELIEKIQRYEESNEICPMDEEKQVKNMSEQDESFQNILNKAIEIADKVGLRQSKVFNNLFYFNSSQGMKAWVYVYTGGVGKELIMVIDGDEKFRDFMGEELGSNSEECEIAENFEEVLGRLQSIL